MNNKTKFKDPCDNCGKFDYCKGVDGKVLCPDCVKQLEATNDGQKN